MKAAACAPGLALALLFPIAALAAPKVEVLLHEVAVGEEGHARHSGSAGGALIEAGRPTRAAISLGIGECVLAPRSTRGGTAVIEPNKLEGQLAWIAEFELLEATLATIRLRADWRRMAWQGERWVEERRENQVLTFRHADRKSHELHPLDFVIEAGGDCRRRSVFIGVSAKLAGPPKLADARFAVDAWWEHAEPSGDLTIRRNRLELVQGELNELTFESLRWPVPDGHGYELVADVLPQIQVLAQDDGRIQVALDVERMFDLAPVGQPRSGGTGGGGRKSFLIEDGETIRMELPHYGPGHSFMGIEHTTTSQRSGMAPAEELLGSYTVEMDAGKFLQDHADALVLTIRRIR